jgi:hypothetical protein
LKTCPVRDTPKGSCLEIAVFYYCRIAWLPVLLLVLESAPNELIEIVLWNTNPLTIATVKYEACKKRVGLQDRPLIDLTKGRQLESAGPASSNRVYCCSACRLANRR